jgi:hypothetical protein
MNLPNDLPPCYPANEAKPSTSQMHQDPPAQINPSVIDEYQQRKAIFEAHKREWHAFLDNRLRQNYPQKLTNIHMYSLFAIGALTILLQFASNHLNNQSNQFGYLIRSGMFLIFSGLSTAFLGKSKN